MQLQNYILRSLSFYKKKHIAVLFATALSTGILTGALIVGDSVRFSLQLLVKQRLGNIAYVSASNEKIVSASLAQNLGSALNAKTTGILSTKGISTNSEKELHINNTQIYGVDSSFWKLSNLMGKALKRNEAYLSQNLAHRLNADSGDMLLLRIQIPQKIAINSPFSQEEKTDKAVRVTVKGILGDTEMGRFSLKSDQKSPFNIFLSYDYLAKQLKLQGQINRILVENKNELSEKQLNKTLQKQWKLSDIGLKLKATDNEQLRLTSDQIFFNSKLAKSIKDFGKTESTFTYLVNNIQHDSLNTPYSFVAGTDNHELKDNEIVVNQWLADDLQLKIGDSIQLKYYKFKTFRKLEEETANFVVAKVEENQGEYFNRNLMPDFPGLKEANSCSEWDAGIAIDLKKIRDKDETYWDEFKGTPKALIRLSAAKRIWENDYGQQTAFFIKSQNTSQKELQNYLESTIQPEWVGLHFKETKNAGELSAKTGVDFGELFLSLSFFVIAASLLLLILIYSFNIQTRNEEIKNLYALGLKQKFIIKAILAEASITIVIGSLLGGLLGIVYNQVIINGLNSIWNEAVYTDSLYVFISWKTVLLGIFIGLFLSFVTLFWLTRKHIKQSLSTEILKHSSSTKRNKTLKMGSFLISGLTVISLVFSLNSIAKNPSFAMIIGALVLLSLLLWFSLWLNQSANKLSNTLEPRTLIVKSLSRFKSQNITIVGILALGVFSVLITGANRQTFNNHQEKRQSGTGGFHLWVESTLPIQYDLNTKEGKQKLNLEDEPTLDSTFFVPMQKLSGDDASCLNLNKVQQPTILSVQPELLDQKKAFSFAKLLPDVNSENPWLYLNKPSNKDVFPVYLDQTVITWGIMKSIGDTLDVLSEKGDSVKLVIAGGLNASIFQGHMLMSEKHFKQLFPSRGGANILLVDCKQNQEKVKESLNFFLAHHGTNIEETDKRLAKFYSVTNTYLNVFMILGSLGILIGTLGLGILIVRNLLERQKEFAVLQAIGIRRKFILSMALKEYSLILFTGLFIGLISALVSMIPSFVSEAFSIPWALLLKILLLISFNGLVWITISTYSILGKRLLPALQIE